MFGISTAAYAFSWQTSAAKGSKAPAEAHDDAIGASQHRFLRPCPLLRWLPLLLQEPTGRAAPAVIHSKSTCWHDLVMVKLPCVELYIELTQGSGASQSSHIITSTP